MTIAIYRLVGEKAVTHRVIPLSNEMSKEDALETLSAVRYGLPPDYGASLTDSIGRNVLP